MFNGMKCHLSPSKRLFEAQQLPSYMADVLLNQEGEEAFLKNRFFLISLSQNQILTPENPGFSVMQRQICILFG